MGHITDEYGCIFMHIFKPSSGELNHAYPRHSSMHNNCGFLCISFSAAAGKKPQTTFQIFLSLKKKKKLGVWQGELLHGRVL